MAHFRAGLLTVSLSLRVAPGRVLFEIGGVPVREELAREGTFLGFLPFPV